MSNTTYIGIAELKISSDPQELLVAPNLGSCLGVTVYDPFRKVGGMIHCLLPTSSSDPEKARTQPAMYVDTGVALLLETLLGLGCQKRNLQIVVAGGSNINDRNNVFEIGSKNFTILRKLLWKNNLLIKAADVGGDHSRTLSLDIASGQVTLRAKGETKLLQ